MPNWLTWLGLGLLVWVLLSVPLSLYLGRVIRVVTHHDAARRGPEARTIVLRPDLDRHAARASHDRPSARRRILIVDDDAGLRMLLRATLTADESEVAEARDAQQASDLARFWRPNLVVADVAMPGLDGLSFCAELKRKPTFGAPAVVLLTGTDLADADAASAGADALLRKPFSPLELVGVVDRLTGAEQVALRTTPADEADGQMILYARDLARMVEIERMQRRVVQHAYRETVTALANALEAKDTGTGLHSLRVRDLAVELTAAVEPSLLADPSLEYGFLLHDVGKIAVPNEVLAKPGPLTPDERRTIRQHTIVGAEILAGITFLHGEGIKIVRSHHERWDGAGYPDHLAGSEIPLGARIFAVADAVDAMTGERPYRTATTWEAATREVASESGRQFDPAVVQAFMRENAVLRRVFDVTGKAA
jgi:ribonuclease P protein subunit RPR2